MVHLSANNTCNDISRSMIIFAEQVHKQTDFTQQTAEFRSPFVVTMLTLQMQLTLPRQEANHKDDALHHQNHNQTANQIQLHRAT